MNKFLPLVPLFAAAMMVAASGMMLHSVHEFRLTMRLDPELELLAIAYLKEERWRQQEMRRADAESRAAAKAAEKFEAAISKGMDDIMNAKFNFDISPEQKLEEQRQLQKLEEQSKAATERTKKQVEENRKRVSEGSPWLKKIWEKDTAPKASPTTK